MRSGPGSALKIAYFTAGTVGVGDLLPGLAIERALQRAGFVGEYRAFGTKSPFPFAEHINYEPVSVRMPELQSPESAQNSTLAQTLIDYAPELLVVGLFWAPLRYILPLPNCQHWLLIRRCPDIWFEGPEFAPFDAGQYERIISIEPLEYDVFTDEIDPLVICNRDECRPRDALRRLLRIEEKHRLVVVAHAGEPGEIDEIPVEEQPKDTIVYYNLFDDLAPFPLAEWLSGADAIFCGAGYNSFWEARTLGYFDRTHFLPFPRHIDDQAWRVRTCSDVHPETNGADVLASWIMGRG